MILTSMEFIRYRSNRYPIDHPLVTYLLPKDEEFYAVPGGGVATAAQCKVWGKENQVKVTFREPTI